MDRLLEKIETDKEVLSTMPRNNKKNIAKYILKIQELEEQYKVAEDKIYDEISKRYKKIISVKENPEIAKKKTEIEELSNFLQILDETQTSYEKMGIDKKVYKLGKFYKENLESINAEILACINKFKEVGIELTKDNFNYSIYVNEYMETFFEQIKNKNINSDILKAKFESVYWRCPDLIIHIELNLRYIYLTNKKIIDKYYDGKKQFIIKQINAQTDKVESRYKKTIESLCSEIDIDKSRIINQFLNGQLSTKDYEEEKIKQEYDKLISNKTQKEINEDSINFLNSLCEYKNFLKYKFIYEDIKKRYNQREEHKNNYNTIKKEISAKEKKLKALNKKINGKSGLFPKKEKKEKQTAQYNTIVKELKDEYRKMDDEEIYQRIIENLNDDSTIFDALYFASKFNNYLTECIIQSNKTITPDEIEILIKEFKEFLANPYIIIIKNISILEEKNIAMIISDKYKLLNFKIEKEDIDEANLDNLIISLQKIKNYYNMKQAGIDLNEMKFICQAKKILETTKTKGNK